MCQAHSGFCVSFQFFLRHFLWAVSHKDITSAPAALSSQSPRWGPHHHHRQHHHGHDYHWSSSAKYQTKIFRRRWQAFSPSPLWRSATHKLLSHFSIFSFLSLFLHVYIPLFIHPHFKSANFSVAIVLYFLSLVCISFTNDPWPLSFSAPQGWAVVHITCQLPPCLASRNLTGNNMKNKKRYSFANRYYWFCYWMINFGKILLWSSQKFLKWHREMFLSPAHFHNFGVI